MSQSAILSPARQPTASAASALAPVAADLKRVDELIGRRLESDVPLVRQVAQYIVAAGGKRLRPALLLLACGALGYRGEPRLTLAAVVEFIHTATLLHDDVVDESKLRRGHETANAAFGNAASVLVGDFLYSRAFQMMVEVDDMRVMRLLADATNTIAAGEVMQLMGSHDPQVDEARYLEVIRRKTAKLFEASARLAAVLAHAAPAVEEGLARYGAHVGTAFQVVDDVLDYSGDEATIGKSLGDDLAEGKPTLPLIHVMRSGAPADQTVVRQAIVSGGRDDFGAVLRALRASGSLDYARAAAQREVQAAIDALAPLPQSEFKRSLLELAAFSVDRQS
ncbi:MAG TPA: polyprenyl synthetase family protein [Burkholderiales bacterium]|nr:polyprenyl synthetase family protein [Burkholderiales bacterium]